MTREVCEMAKRVKCVLPKREDLSLAPNSDVDATRAADTWNSCAALQERQEGPRGFAGQSRQTVSSSFRDETLSVSL